MKQKRSSEIFSVKTEILVHKIFFRPLQTRRQVSATAQMGWPEKYTPSIHLISLSAGMFGLPFLISRTALINILLVYNCQDTSPCLMLEGILFAVGEKSVCSRPIVRLTVVIFKNFIKLCSHFMSHALH